MSAPSQVKTLLDIAYRRKWWIGIPLVLSIIASFFVLSRLPKIYRASTTILVTQPRLPSNIAPMTVTVRAEERMASLRVQVMSRTYLEKVAREFGLVAPDATEAYVERACRVLESKVDLEWEKRNFAWFRISVDDLDPKKAAGIANRLATLFIEQNTALREEQAADTLETVQGWLDRVKAELDARDAEIASYRQAHLWELPEQQAANLQLLNAAQQRVNQLTTDIQTRAARLQTLSLEEQTRSALDVARGTSGTGGNASAQRLTQLEAELSQLMVSYTELSPDVRRKREEIAEFKRAHPEATAPAGVGPDGTPITEAQQIQTEMGRLERERVQELDRIEEIRARLTNLPRRQQELAALSLGYDTLRRQYDEKLAMKDQAERAQDMESAKKGEQFQVQDRAVVPAVPFSPKPAQVFLVCIAIGLGIGVGASALLEVLDQSVKTVEEFSAAFPDLPVLTAVPDLDAAVREQRRSRPRRGRVASLVPFLVLLAGWPVAGPWSLPW